MNHRIGRAHKLRVIAGVQMEAWIGQVAAKNANPRMQGIFELREIHVQLQRMPQPFARFLLVRRAHQQIQRVTMTRK